MIMRILFYEHAWTLWPDPSACIFCEELIPSDSEECPNCDKKPFSGILDTENTRLLNSSKRKEKGLELLHEEWMVHGDVDYYDDEMYFELLGEDELYERNPSLIRQRVDLIKDYWRNAVYYAYVVHKNDIEEGLEIVRKPIVKIWKKNS